MRLITHGDCRRRAVQVAALHTQRADRHPAALGLAGETGNLLQAPGSSKPGHAGTDRGARHTLETTDAMMNADGSGDTSQDRKVFVRRAEPVPTARAARDGQIRASSGTAGWGIFHIASIPRGGHRCRNPLSWLIKTRKREKECIKLI